MLLRRALVAAALCLVSAAVADVRFVVEFLRNAATQQREERIFFLLAHALLGVFAVLNL